MKAIGFKVYPLDINKASVRYRALLPMRLLEKEGIECHLFSDATHEILNKVDIIVFVKCFSVNDCRLAQRARNAGKSVIIDLCDNIFIDGYDQTKSAAPNAISYFFFMAGLADAIIVTTHTLKEAVLNATNINKPIYVIPDGIETEDIYHRLKKRFKRSRNAQRIRLLKRGTIALFSFRFQVLTHSILLGIYKRNIQTLSKRLRFTKEWFLSMVEGLNPSKAHDGYNDILWFGMHGDKHARFGLYDLYDIQHELEKVAKTHKVRLIVISNNLEQYNQLIKPMKIISEYRPWSSISVYKALKKADIVILPNNRDAFSICKSSNRTIMSLSMGVPVVASLTPVLSEFESCIPFDSFENAIKTYLNDKKKALEDVIKGRQIIQKHFSDKVIYEHWKRVIDNLKVYQNHREASLVVVLHLPQDLDIALPVLKKAKEQKISSIAYCDTALLSKSPRVIRKLVQSDIKVWMLDKSMIHHSKLFHSKTKALLSITESNLPPHEFGRAITIKANKTLIPTATIQHGFENIGLTYSDKIYPINNVHFMSNKIYLWGAIETLHPDVPNSTRKKCVPIGYPKSISCCKQITDYKDIRVGVFENLHWLRYTDTFRLFFVESILKMANEFQDVTFLLKPHHTGLWLTKRHKKALTWPKNIEVIDPQKKEHEPHTAQDYFATLTAVITTPSTVALDAAVADLPVGILAAASQLDKYYPLKILSSEEALRHFVSSLNIDKFQSHMRKTSRQFCERNLLNKNGAKHILKDILQEHPMLTGETHAAL